MDGTGVTPTAPGPVPEADAVPAIASAIEAVPETPVPLPHTPADPTPIEEHVPMATNYDFNKDPSAAHNAVHDVTQGAQHMADQVRTHSEDALKQGQAAFAQATEKSREVMDKGMKAMDEFGGHARGQADAFMTASKAAVQGIEAMVSQATELGRKSFEQATAAMRTIAAARTPQDVFAAQNEYVKSAFDNLVHGYSKMTETVMKVSNEVIQPLQSHMTEAAQKAGDAVKSTMGSLTK